ncbi:MAG: zinc-dependent peptidase [Acidobacteriota bacterium]|nr:zinc-dependent peptidase [Acidobacteriota bacterium]
MRVFPRFELFFLAFYTSLIVLVGVLVFFMTGSGETLILAALLLAFYLALALGKPLRRRRAARAQLPGEWREFLQAQSPFYRGLEDKGRAGFERDVRLFLAETRIAGTGGAPVSWQSRLLVAAGAAIMLHGRPDQEPPLRDGVTVYPGRAFDRNYRAGQGNIAGQAPAGGPLLVAEKSLHEGFADGHDGTNVIIHELAHYFDHEARKGGLKIVGASGVEMDWREAIAGEYRTHDFAASALDPYAAQNEAEFFACASEVFFERPGHLAAIHPGLFSLLVEFYGQDPRTTIMKGDR